MNKIQDVISSMAKMAQLSEGEHEPRPQEVAPADTELFGYKPKTRNAFLGGVQLTFDFPNGYGASVVRHLGSYGGAQGLWELAVLGQDGHLCYATPVTDDVLGYLQPAEVTAHLAAIAELDSPAAKRE